MPGYYAHPCIIICESRPIMAGDVANRLRKSFQSRTSADDSALKGSLCRTVFANHIADTRTTKPNRNSVVASFGGVFCHFERQALCRLMEQSGHSNRTRVCPQLGQGGHCSALALNASVANDPKRTLDTVNARQELFHSEAVTYCCKGFCFCGPAMRRETAYGCA